MSADTAAALADITATCDFFHRTKKSGGLGYSIAQVQATHAYKAVLELGGTWPAAAPTPAGPVIPRVGIACGSSFGNGAYSPAVQDSILADFKTLGALVNRFDYGSDTLAGSTAQKCVASQVAPLLIAGASLAPSLEAFHASRAHRQAAPHRAGRHDREPMRATTTSQFAAAVKDAVNVLTSLGIARPLVELLNEPDLHGWTGATYTPYLIAGYEAAKQANPHAFVLPGGLFNYGYSSTGKTSATFVTEMYAAGAKGHMDACNLHLYGDGSDGTWSVWSMAFGSGGKGFYDQPSQNVRGVMNLNGDSALPLVTTESGDSAVASGAAAQANAVTYVLGCADGIGTGNRKLLSSLVYTDRDASEVAGFGLRDGAGNPRPAYAAFKAVAT